MANERYVVTIDYSWKGSDQIHKKTLWDIDSEIWLKENAEKCAMIKTSYPVWESVMDFSSGMVISLIKKPKDE
ncbi:MAG: hypothetical protein QG599_2839 [Pseudomonadota bacterium]|nr:hypothetical protein [Pseudomonadota bacterium]